MAQRCKDSFSHNAWHAGEDYFRGGRVAVIDAGDEWLIAHVSDRDGTQNEIDLDWSSLMDGDDDLILADCTCERASAGHLCRHIAGVIQSMERDRNAPTIPGSFDLIVQLDTDVVFERTTAPHQGREKFSSTITVNPASEFLPSAPRSPASSQASAAAKAAIQRA
ncbi:MAG TPA: SWIM zinc finger family protein, partial [Pirellulales bacterium]